jgi:phosphoribosyl 1,2-cyclic phosphodiesterase
MSLEVRFWGVRGSFPAIGPSFARYGGDTSCVGVTTGDGRRLAFDCGSGFVRFGKTLPGPVELDLFLSHPHLDHIMGLAFFDPLWRPDSVIRIWLEESRATALREALLRQFGPPFHPVPLSEVPATVGWRTYRMGEAFAPLPGVRLLAADLPHPGGSCGFRLESDGKSVIYGADSGALEGDARAAALAWAKDADLAILDATFTCAESEARPDWGHMSWKEAVAFGAEAGAKHVALFHHGPDRTDEELDAIEREARTIMGGAVLAQDGMTIVL